MSGYDFGNHVFVLVCLSPRLLHGPGHRGAAGEAGLPLLGDPRQQLLDLSDGATGVEALGTGLGAVHDGVTPVHTEGVPQSVQPLGLLAVSAVDDPPVGLHQDGGAKVPETGSSVLRNEY